MHSNRILGLGLVAAGIALWGALWAVLYRTGDIGLAIAIRLGLPGILGLSLVGGWFVVFGLVFSVAPDAPRRARRLRRSLGSRLSPRSAGGSSSKAG